MQELWYEPWFLKLRSHVFWLESPLQFKSCQGQYIWFGVGGPIEVQANYSELSMKVALFFVLLAGKLNKTNLINKTCAGSENRMCCLSSQNPTLDLNFRNLQRESEKYQNQKIPVQVKCACAQAWSKAVHDVMNGVQNRTMHIGRHLYGMSACKQAIRQAGK